MEKNQISFEQILNATLSMLRQTWNTTTCLFFQIDDAGNLRIRGGDGLKAEDVVTVTLDSSRGAASRCCAENKIIEVHDLAELGPLETPLRSLAKKNEKFILAPVSGEARVIGILFLGPFPHDADLHKREAELRSAGALCAVLSAHWRLYEWMESIVPQLNHSLRTPLTAIQGSIGMVLGGVFGQVGHEVKEMLEMAQKGCERTVRTIEDYLNSQTPSKD